MGAIVPNLTEYRAFVLNHGGRIVKRHDFEAENDGQAVRVGLHYLDGHDVEVWQLDRIVKRLNHREE